MRLQQGNWSQKLLPVLTTAYIRLHQLDFRATLIIIDKINAVVATRELNWRVELGYIYNIVTKESQTTSSLQRVSVFRREQLCHRVAEVTPACEESIKESCTTRFDHIITEAKRGQERSSRCRMAYRGVGCRRPTSIIVECVMRGHDLLSGRKRSVCRNRTETCQSRNVLPV
jgi:hypothetical protein